MTKSKSKKQPEFEKVEQRGFFNVVRHESGEHFIALGDYAVLKCESKEKAQQLIDDKDWELLLNVMVAIANKVQQKEKEKEQ